MQHIDILDVYSYIYILRCINYDSFLFVCVYFFKFFFHKIEIPRNQDERFLMYTSFIC